MAISIHHPGRLRAIVHRPNMSLLTELGNLFLNWHLQRCRADGAERQLVSWPVLPVTRLPGSVCFETPATGMNYFHSADVFILFF